MPATQRKCIYGGVIQDVDRHYKGSVTVTTHQETGIITLESNSSRGTVLPAPHGKGNKCDKKNVTYKRTDALSLWHQQLAHIYLLLLKCFNNSKLSFLNQINEKTNKVKMSQVVTCMK